MTKVLPFVGLRVILLTPQHSHYFSGPAPFLQLSHQQVDEEEGQEEEEAHHGQVDLQVLVGAQEEDDNDEIISQTWLLVIEDEDQVAPDMQGRIDHKQHPTHQHGGPISPEYFILDFQ